MATKSKRSADMFSISDAWNGAKASHQKYVTELIDDALKAPMGHGDYIKSPDLRTFISTNKTAIATGNPGVLRALIKQYEAIKAQAGPPGIYLFLEEAQKIFDYKKFSAKRKRRWCAYLLCKTSPYKICPYCNQNFAFTLAAVDGEFRPTLDHFYPKAQYPFLALSLYNLVPSCYTCNSNLKGTADFFINAHLHPLKVATSLKFHVQGKNGADINELVNDEYKFRKFGEIRPVQTNSETHKNSIKTFLLEERFDFSETEFLQFAYYRRQLTSTRVKEISEIVKMPTSAVSLLRFDPKNFRNVIHGKIYLDIFNQFEPN